MLLAVPIVGILIKAWPATVACIVVPLLLQMDGALLYLVVLPEEWNASSQKALPILVDGEHAPFEFLPAVRSVLRAAALTYFAGALASIVNTARWALILRRCPGHSGATHAPAATIDCGNAPQRLRSSGGVNQLPALTV